MRKFLAILLLYLVFFLILALVGCTTTIVRPVYIDPEADLSHSIEKTRREFQTQPTIHNSSNLLGDSLLYYDRMNDKVRDNNCQAMRGTKC